MEKRNADRWQPPAESWGVLQYQGKRLDAKILNVSNSGARVLTGLVFGLWPARKASRLNPIEALRYE